MKKIRHFRESIDTSLLQCDGEAWNHFVPEGVDIETGLEIVITWLELFRDELRHTGNPLLLLDSLRAVTKESLLWLKIIHGETRIVMADVDIPLSVEKALCQNNGPFCELANIRFAHHYTQLSDLVVRLVQMGHPTISRLLAVPIFEKNRVNGVLAILGTQGITYEKKDEMLLSFVAILLSMLKIPFINEGER